MTVPEGSPKTLFLSITFTPVIILLLYHSNPRLPR